MSFEDNEEEKIITTQYPKRKSLRSSDAISENQTTIKNEDIFGLKEPKERSGSSETALQQAEDSEEDSSSGCVQKQPCAAEGEEDLTGLDVKGELEPEDNFDENLGAQSDDEYDTEEDTDELNHFNTSSNNSQQDKLLHGSIGSTRLSRGGIRCLRSVRKKTRRKIKPMKKMLLMRAPKSKDESKPKP